jgi:hypothetical protein
MLWKHIRKCFPNSGEGCEQRKQDNMEEKHQVVREAFPVMFSELVDKREACKTESRRLAENSLWYMVQKISDRDKGSL